MPSVQFLKYERTIGLQVRTTIGSEHNFHEVDRIRGAGSCWLGGLNVVTYSSKPFSSAK